MLNISITFKTKSCRLDLFSNNNKNLEHRMKNNGLAYFIEKLCIQILFKRKTERKMREIAALVQQNPSYDKCTRILDVPLCQKLILI